MPRQYLIPAALVHAGANTIAVRAFAHNNGGGFEGPADAMHLRVVNGSPRARVSLAGPWHFRAETPLPPRGDLGRAVVPTTVFNAMIAPLTQLAIAGFLWYQGESNVDEPAEYRTLFPLMIRDWRRYWGDANLPFYFVQLQDYGSVLGGENLALLREVQTQTLRVPHTGMAVAIDGGEGDVHPRKKQPIGRRLALQALAKTYGRPVECEGPAFRSMAIEGARVRIRFDHARGLTTADGGSPADFVIAGADGRFVPARARIEGDAVVVWSPKVPHPVAVRYAWGATPKANLFNAEGLPAGPFRTDE